MLLDNARYDFGLVFLRLMPHNGDGTIPTVSRILGGVGPFDFSKALLPAAVTIKWKIDAGTEQDDTIDLSTVSSISAVTLTELLAACTASSLSGLTTSKDTDTSRFKIALTTPGTVKWLQVYGEVAKYAGIGQGYGAKFIKLDTAQSLAEEPTMKADETKTKTDANGKDIEVQVDGYRKGAAYTLIDLAHDDELRAMLTGAVYDESVAGAETFEEPTIDSVKPTLFLEAYYAAYLKGTNKLADRVGYKKRLIRSAKCTSAKPGTRQLDFAEWTYALSATAYKTEAGVYLGDARDDNLTVSAFQALNLENV
jgi:hypothetical protein